MKARQSTVIDISLSKEQVLLHYRGQVGAVRAYSRSGECVQFPINILRPYITDNGVHGVFEIQYDKQHKFTGIRCLNNSEGLYT